MNFAWRAKKISFEDTLKQLLGYTANRANITIIDLSGVPFEVLSITVSLISKFYLNLDIIIKTASYR